MSFVLSGENIVRGGKCGVFVLAIAAALFVGCGGDTDKPAANAGSDQEQMQATLNEVVTRWKHEDKAALYDNEFEYLHERLTFDDYLKANELQMNADTLKQIDIKEVVMFGQDTADVKVEVVFEGPTGKVSRMRDVYRMFRHHGRWIRPTLSSPVAQQEYEQSRRAYDSAVEAEEEELGDK